jgi:secreted trypsin-like serine protease
LSLALVFFLRFALADERVVNGRPVVPGVFPDIGYQAQLRLGDRVICGGSFISKTFVLTAAHCLPEKGPNEEPLDPRVAMVVQAGLQRLPDGKRYAIKNAWIHPEYVTSVDFMILHCWSLSSLLMIA